MSLDRILEKIFLDSDNMNDEGILPNLKYLDSADFMGKKI